MTKEKTLNEINQTNTYLTELVARDKKTNPDKKKEMLALLEACKTEREKEYTANDVPDYLNCKITFVIINFEIVKVFNLLHLFTYTRR